MSGAMRRSRALAFAALLLAVPATAQSRWTGELAGGHSGGLGNDLGGSVAVHATGLYRRSRTLSTGLEGVWQPYAAFGAGAYGARTRDEIIVGLD